MRHRGNVAYCRSWHLIFTMAVERLTIYLGLSKSPIAVPDWNNAPERTQAEVVAAFRGCAREP